MRGRITQAQKKALMSCSHMYKINFSKATIELDRIFKRIAPKILEIGSGMGHTITQLAMENKENDYLAIEVYPAGIGSLIRKIEINKLPNVRFISHDATEILKYQLPADSIEHIYIFFPDPWPKKRHHKRRLINAQFLSLVKVILKEHGRLFIATDEPGYARQITDIASQRTDIINLAGDDRYSPSPRWRLMTKFEKKGIKKNRHIYNISLAFKY